MVLFKNHRHKQTDMLEPEVFFLPIWKMYSIQQTHWNRDTSLHIALADTSLHSITLAETPACTLLWQRLQPGQYYPSRLQPAQHYSARDTSLHSIITLTDTSLHSITLPKTPACTALLCQRHQPAQHYYARDSSLHSITLPDTSLHSITLAEKLKEREHSIKI